MKRFYFLKYKERVFALEPKTRTLITTPAPPNPDPTAPALAGEPRTTPLATTLQQTTLEALGVPPGKRNVQRAELWEYTPLRALIERELNQKRKIGKPHQTVYPFTTPLPKPLVAFLAQEIWTVEDQCRWEMDQRERNTRKKRHQRANRKATKKQPQAEGWVNPSLEEESE